jgi:hypothetical protein
LEQPSTYGVGVAWPEKVHNGVSGRRSALYRTEARERAFDTDSAGFVQVGKVFFVHEVLDALALL